MSVQPLGQRHRLKLRLFPVPPFLVEVVAALIHGSQLAEVCPGRARVYRQEGTFGACLPRVIDCSPIPAGRLVLAAVEMLDRYGCPAMPYRPFTRSSKFAAGGTFGNFC